MEMSQKRANRTGDNYEQPHPIFTNDDLLIKILIRLPVLCIHLFTTVSKRWLRILTSDFFKHNCIQIDSLDHPAGLFVRHMRDPFTIYFVSFDSRIQSKEVTVKKAFDLEFNEEAFLFGVAQSCNGLFLCYLSGLPSVCNPSTKDFTILPKPDDPYSGSPSHYRFGMRMAFDPTISPNYKVVCATRTRSHIYIQTYCSDTQKWSLGKNWFTDRVFFKFTSAIYLNGALHWLQLNDTLVGFKHYRLNIEDHDQPILTTFQIPQGLNRLSNFFKPLDNNIPGWVATHAGHKFHDEVKLVESRGCLLVALRDYYGSRDFTIYEMRNGCSTWLARYLVNIDDFKNQLPECWSICSTVWSIVLGKREEDSCLVINLVEKVVKYNLISKTVHEIYRKGSNHLNDTNLDANLVITPSVHVIAPYISDHQVYQFIPSFARV